MQGLLVSGFLPLSLYVASVENIRKPLNKSEDDAGPSGEAVGELRESVQREVTSDLNRSQSM